MSGMSTTDTSIAGLVLAAGAGSRYGMPKALARGPDGTPWLLRAARTLEDAGCSPVIVVLGARGDEAERLLPDSKGLLILHVPNWSLGVSASIRAGLAAVAALDPLPTAVAVVPVDVPDLNAATVARLIGDWPAADEDAASVTPSTLRQATFQGRPGHPVVIGNRHWEPLAESLEGDVGARPYLMAHGVRMIGCGDLSLGVDIDVDLGQVGT